MLRPERQPWQPSPRAGGGNGATRVGDWKMKTVIWTDQVQVQILEMRPVNPNHPKLKSARVLWGGISLAEAVRRWQQLQSEDQGLVTIFGTETFVGKEIGDLAKRADFPKDG